MPGDAEDVPHRLATIEEAKTLSDVQRVFVEMVDENESTGAPSHS